MSQITIRPMDELLTRFGNQLGALSDDEAIKAMVRAVNRTTRTVHGRVIKAVAKQSSIPRKLVAKHVKARMASTKGLGPIEGVVYSTGTPLPLHVFGAKQFGFGVRTKERGVFKRYPGLFIYGGHYRSGDAIGHGQVFANTGGYSGSSKRNNAIEKQYSDISIPAELIEGESAYQFANTVATMLPNRVAHEIGRILNI